MLRVMQRAVLTNRVWVCCVAGFASMAVSWGCAGSSPGSSGSTLVPPGSSPGTVLVGYVESVVLVVRSQRSDGTVVVVERVELKAPGYVAVYRDGGGAPGRRLGSTGLLAAGEHENVEVRLSVEEMGSSAKVYVMAHTETNANTLLDWPGVDTPVSEAGSIVVARVPVEVAPGASR